MMITVFKAIHFDTMQKYLSGLFQIKNTADNLRRSNKLVVPCVNTTTHGLHSFTYASLSNDVERTH